MLLSTEITPSETAIPSPILTIPLVSLVASGTVADTFIVVEPCLVIVQFGVSIILPNNSKPSDNVTISIVSKP